MAAAGRKGFLLNTTKNTAAPVAGKPRDRGEAETRHDQNWKPEPCLLTRREMQALVAEMLG
jgi:hypothetical protein